MAITKLNSLAIPPDTVVESDISFPLDSASFTGDLTVDTDTLVVDSTNNRVNVGNAGTITPYSQGDNFVIDAGGTDDGMSIIASNSSNIFFGDAAENRAGRILYLHSDDSMRFYTNGNSNKMTITSGGNVGIGTSPSSNLHVYNGTDAEEQVIIAEVSGGFSNGAGVSLRRSGTEMGRINADYFNGMTFHATTGSGGAATERMRIDSSGRVGINESDPLATLAVRGITSTLSSFEINCNSGGATIEVLNRNADADQTFGFYANQSGTFTFNNGAPYTEKVRIDSSGNLLVGATSQVSTETLGVTTSSGIVALFKVNQPSGTNVHTAFYNSTGVAAKIDRAGLYTQVSDRSLKHDVSDSTLGLTEVLNIPVRSFKWNGSEDYVAAGFIAQELEQALPSAVSTDEDTGLKGRSDGNIVPVLVKAIQEQQAMIETLQAQVAELQGAN